MAVYGLRDSILLHTSPLFAHALRTYTSENPGIAIRASYYSWTDFIPDRETCPQWVIVDGLLDDYVPVLVKVRALRKLGATPIVLGGLNQPQCELFAVAGAAGVITEDLTIPELADEIGNIVNDWTPASQSQEADPCPLTDRELQILELHSRRRGLQASVLGPALGLSAETVRVHIRNGRKKLADLGLECTSRGQVSQALVAMGYSLSDEQWRQAGRW